MASRTAYAAVANRLDWLVAAAVLLYPGPAAAAGSTDPVNAITTTGMLGDYFRMLWGLLVVLGLILLLYGLLKKRFSLVGGHGNAIKVVEMRPLAPKKSLCLVEVKGREYLLGLGPDSVTLLAALDGDSHSTFQEVLEGSATGRRS